MAVVGGVVVAAAYETDNARPRPGVDPQLLMAARRGDSKLLEEKLVGLNDDRVEAAASEEAVVVVDVVVVDVVPPPPRRTPPPPPPPPPPPAAADVIPASSSSLPAAPPPPLDGVTAEGDTLLHVVAECGDGLEFRRCARLIYDTEKRLLDARNGRGDTPLHCAARAGNAEMISFLIDLAAASRDGKAATEAERKVAYLRVHNNRGETALHHAVRAVATAAGRKGGRIEKQLDCIDRLIAEDAELAAIPPPSEKAAASPLYLAISLGEIGIAKHLFVISEGNLSCSGPNGRNVLHAAVSHDQALQALPMVLEWLQNKKLKTADVDMQQLTSQRDKDNGSTPLHLAASMAGLPSLGSKSAGRSATRLLLDANVSTAYQPDNQGRYPIHAAASAGSLEAVKALLQKCPDCATLRDARGRTFLHAAVEKTSLKVINYVLGSPGLSSILNLQDDNGDTALHSAVRTKCFRAVRCLLKHPQVRLDMPNKEGMMPADVSWSMMPLKTYYAWDPSIQIRNLLWILRAPFGESRGDLFDEKHAKRDMEKMSENITTAAQVLALLSVVITTVTFASAFTLPGGYRSAGDYGGAAGTPVLARRGSYAFDAFILADALAFVCSFVATSLLLYAGVPTYKLEVRLYNINFAHGLMMNSGKCLMVALALGFYVVLLPPVGRTIATEIGVVMIMLSIVEFTKDSVAGFELTFIIVPVKRNNWKPSQGVVQSFIIYFCKRYLSFILIFGLPAIHKWAKAK